MTRIGKGKFVIAVISDKYLKSHNCMFELMQVFSNGNFHERIFPIVLPDAKIFNPFEFLDYVEYWEEEGIRLNERLQKVRPEFLHGIREKVDRYAEIRNTIAQLTDTISNMNVLSPDIHSQSDFTALHESIAFRISEYKEVSGLRTDSSMNTIENRTLAKRQQERLDEGINQLVDSLQDTISKDLREVLAWLSNYKERAHSIGKLALSNHPVIQDEVVKDLRKSKRFYKELENCFYRLHFSIFTDSYSPINEAKVSFKAEVYKTALDMVEIRIPTNDEQTKEKFRESICYFKERLDALR